MEKFVYEMNGCAWFDAAFHHVEVAEEAVYVIIESPDMTHKVTVREKDRDNSVAMIARRLFDMAHRQNFISFNQVVDACCRDGWSA